MSEQAQSVADTPLGRPMIYEVAVASLVEAEWNYKVAATPDQAKRLAASIERDKSAGVLAVRQLGDGRLEVIDGNHRFGAIRDVLQWQRVMVEDFGPISLADAVTIAARRNHQWVDEDLAKLSTLVRDVVMPEVSLADLAAFMPQDSTELENLAKLSQFDWNNLPPPPPSTSQAMLHLPVNDEAKALWERWSKFCREDAKIEDRTQQFILALKLALEKGATGAA